VASTCFLFLSDSWVPAYGGGGGREKLRSETLKVGSRYSVKCALSQLDMAPSVTAYTRHQPPPSQGILL
jgi:hypothetical protein